MPDERAENMSNGKCGADEDKILENHDAFLAEPTLDGKVMRLGENFRDGRIATVRGFAALRRLLPWRPWMLRVLAGVGVVGVVGVIWAASAFNTEVKTNVRSNKICAEEAKAAAHEAHEKAVAVKEDLMGQLRPVSEASAIANAKLDMLLDARGIGQPSKAAIRASRSRLGLDSLTAIDSAPRGAH